MKILLPFIVQLFNRGLQWSVYWTTVPTEIQERGMDKLVKDMEEM